MKIKRHRRGKSKYKKKRRKLQIKNFLRAHWKFLIFLLVLAFAAALVITRSLWFPRVRKLVVGDWHTDATKGKEEPKLVSGELAVHFIDVGQGNCVLITDGTNAMLIDGGDKDHANVPVAYLEKREIYYLNYMISSHYDADHIYGLITVLGLYPVGLLLDADYVWDTATYTSFTTAVLTNGCEEVHPQAGETYTLGEAKFTVVCPDTYDHEDSNDNSIGIRLVYGGTSFLICGDATSEMEDWMIASGMEIDSDVLMASHHGSTYSTSEAFLKAVSPQAVVISCGMDNDYGHPSARVMNLLAAYGCDVYRTDLQSTIIAITDGQYITFNQDPTDNYSSGWSQ